MKRSLSFSRSLSLCFSNSRCFSRSLRTRSASFRARSRRSFSRFSCSLRLSKRIAISFSRSLARRSSLSLCSLSIFSALSLLIWSWILFLSFSASFSDFSSSECRGFSLTSGLSDFGVLLLELLSFLELEPLECFSFFL